MSVQADSPREARRWRAALAQALDEALDVLVCPATGQAFVESATHPGRLYAVTATTCSCAAGQRGLPCAHVACYRAQQRLLALDPAPLVSPVALPHRSRRRLVPRQGQNIRRRPSTPGEMRPHPIHPAR